MTNYEAWQLAMRDVPAPALFKEWGFYSMIGAALERRVTVFASDDYPVMANMYVFLVGAPGTGKGLTTNKVKSMLKIEKPDTRSQEQRIADAAKTGPREPQYIFPMAAASTTYESFLCCINDAARPVDVLRGGKKVKEFHAPTTFLLDEVTSLFVKGNERLATALLVMWDGQDYSNKTKNKGNDFVKNPVVNVLGGTTPHSLQNIIRSEFIGTGMSSRVVFIYVERSERKCLVIPPADEEQRAAEKQLKDYIIGLSKVSGNVKLAPATITMMNERMNRPAWKTNKAGCLEDYYERKPIHLMKLMLIRRMSEPGWSNAGELSPDEALEALAILERAEINMHVPLAGGGRNELAPIATRVVRCLRARGPLTEQELLVEFYNDCSHEELQSVLVDLQTQYKISYNVSKYSATS